MVEVLRHMKRTTRISVRISEGPFVVAAVSVPSLWPPILSASKSSRGLDDYNMRMASTP